ncbi:MAG: metallophosphoesterase [bacterium]
MMRRLKLGNRTLLRIALYAIPSVCIIDGLLVEPGWIRTRKLDLGGKEPTHRIVHFTDLHYTGDRKTLKGVVDKINKLDPDFVCFTGDLVDEKEYLGEALALLRKIRRPVFGVPGNHEYWCGAPFDEISEAFRATGGAWLVDQAVESPDGKIIIVGASNHDAAFIKKEPLGKSLLLTHYPSFVDLVKGAKFNLILAGHSHGGQLRIPFWGAVAVPWGTGPYEMGSYQTAAGPLYVNPGIGTFYLPVRLFCRPEITEITF